MFQQKTMKNNSYFRIPTSEFLLQNSYFRMINHKSEDAESDREVTITLQGLPNPSFLLLPSNTVEAEQLLYFGEKCFKLALGFVDNPEREALRSIMMAILCRIKAQRRFTSEEIEDPLTSLVQRRN